MRTSEPFGQFSTPVHVEISGIACPHLDPRHHMHRAVIPSTHTHTEKDTETQNMDTQTHTQTETETDIKRQGGGGETSCAHENKEFYLHEARQEGLRGKCQTGHCDVWACTAAWTINISDSHCDP